MKPVSEWDQSDLLALIANEVQESLELDYKQSDALAKTDKAKNEISKDVSAFANSAGGRIIYGVVEQGHKPTRLDSGSDPANITREWLEQVINSTIQQRIPGVRIKVIPLSTGGHAFVVDIPRSETGPHQANDKRYYRRFEFQSVPMHDYEVRDVAGRATGPSLYLGFEFAPLPGVGVPDRFSLRVSIGNRTSEPALYTSIMLAFEQPALLTLEGHASWTIETKTLRAMSDAVSADVFVGNRAVPNAMPIFAGLDDHLTSFHLNVPPNHFWRMAYSLNCPGFAERRYGNLMRRGGDPYIEFSDARFSLE